MTDPDGEAVIYLDVAENLECLIYSVCSHVRPTVPIDSLVPE